LQQLSSSHLQNFRLYICNPQRDDAAAYEYNSGIDEISRISFIIKIERAHQVKISRTFVCNLEEFLTEKYIAINEIIKKT
tara:strand:- start:1573 stop:1812 length:240 start_codon:yes stop_codon:yes gene_type:complete